MHTAEERLQFLRAFYDLDVEEDPHNVIDAHDVSRLCGLDASKGREIAQSLADAGVLLPKGRASHYRLTPKGRMDIHEELTGPPPESTLTFRVTIGTPAIDAPYPEHGEAPSNVHSITLQDREAVAATLAAVKQCVAQGERLGKHDAEKVCEVVGDIEREMEASDPNILKLQGLLVGLAVAVQTDTSHAPADHAARVSFSFLGLNLL